MSDLSNPLFFLVPTCERLQWTPKGGPLRPPAFVKAFPLSAPVNPGPMDLAKAGAQAASRTAADLAGLSPDASFFVYMNMDASTVDRLQGMSVRMMNPGGKPTPDQAKALALFGEVGRVETIGS